LTLIAPTATPRKKSITRGKRKTKKTRKMTNVLLALDAEKLLPEHPTDWPLYERLKGGE